MTVFPDVFTEMAVLLLFAVAVGALGVRLRQPLIFAFIAVGILVGPSVLGWVSANDQVDLLAKFGITLFFCAGNLAETLGVHKISEMNGAGRRMPLDHGGIHRRRLRHDRRAADRRVYQQVVSRPGRIGDGPGMGDPGAGWQ
jgi:hypothetical protein